MSLFPREAMLEGFRFARWRFCFETRGLLRLPSANRVNPLRGAFGLRLRRRSCPLRPPCADRCQLREECLYGRLFQPAPPSHADRLTANSDIPRPFLIRVPPGDRTEFPPGSELSFDLVLFGFAMDLLPVFAQVFDDVGRGGLGPSRRFPYAIEAARNWSPSGASWSRNCFQMLGISAAAGRTFSWEEDAAQAAWLPARRAARVNPADALRCS